MHWFLGRQPACSGLGGLWLVSPVSALRPACVLQTRPLLLTCVLSGVSADMDLPPNCKRPARHTSAMLQGMFGSSRLFRGYLDGVRVMLSSWL